MDAMNNSYAIYRFKIVMVKLYDSRVSLRSNGFRLTKIIQINIHFIRRTNKKKNLWKFWIRYYFFMIFGPIHTLNRYVSVKKNVGAGESTKSMPFVRPSEIFICNKPRFLFKLLSFTIKLM